MTNRLGYENGNSMQYLKNLCLYYC